MAFFTPLGRGLLTTAGPQLAAQDLRRSMPRFEEDNRAANAPLLAGLHALATAKSCTPAQLALAWLLAQDARLLPIPGTKRVEYLEENAAAADVALSPAEGQQLQALLAAHPVAGARYGESAARLVNR